MRALMAEIVRRGYRFVMEYDTGGGDEQYVCWVYKKNGEFLCRKYFKNFDSTFYKFYTKFANDSEFRNSYIYWDSYNARISARGDIRVWI